MWSEQRSGWEKIDCESWIIAIRGFSVVLIMDVMRIMMLMVR